MKIENLDFSFLTQVANLKISKKLFPSPLNNSSYTKNISPGLGRRKSVNHLLYNMTSTSEAMAYKS